MICAKNLTKRFSDVVALNRMNCTIPDGCIYGLIGANGAGKSTFLRLVSGIFRPDEGEITIDGKTVFDHPSVKRRFVFVPDDLFFLPQSNLYRMARLYASAYDTFDYERFRSLVKRFRLNPEKQFSTFSKGMKRQAATILALSAKTDYIFFDETFDGLDPVMRNLVKRTLYSDVMDRNATAVISGHSLRELEDTCDQLALLYNGGIVIESDLDHIKTTLFKVQVAFREAFDRSLFEGIDLLSFTKQGSVANLIVRGDREETVRRIQAMNPVLFEILPLTLEEVFVYEMEALGYVFEDDEIRKEQMK